MYINVSAVNPHLDSIQFLHGKSRFGNIGQVGKIYYDCHDGKCLTFKFYYLLKLCFLQCLIRQYILFVHANDIKSLLFEQAIDWPSSIQTRTKVISEKFLVKIFKILGPIIPLNVFLFLLKPLLFNSLPMAAFYGTLNFWFIYVFQILYFTYAIVLYLSFDILFVLICVYLINQLRYLRAFFEEISFRNKEQKEAGVKHHILIMR